MSSLPPELQRLLKRLSSRSPAVRCEAACALRKRGARSPRAFAALLRLLKDADSQVRLFAAQALAVCGGRRAVRPLLASMEDPVHWNENAAANALGDIGDLSAVPHLVRSLRGHPNSRVRRAATVALAKLKARRAVLPLARALLNDGDVDVRIESARALGFMGDRRALPSLRKASAEHLVPDSDLVRDAAHEAIESIQRGRGPR